MHPSLERSWPLVVLYLIASSVTCDVLGKLHHTKTAIGLGIVSCFVWPLLLGSKAPFTRSIAIFSVSNYVLSALVGVLYFKETLTPVQVGALIVGLGVMVVLT
jgi:multidrug transporter EmrE-like cation transporter